MEKNKINYEEYEWINYFYDGYNVTSFNNLLDSLFEKNDLNNIIFY